MKRLLLLLLVIVALFFPQDMGAQCAMCRAVLESEGNVDAAEGVNNGIVYLMAIPYVLVGFLFYFIYRMMRPKKIG
ncbi:hypothetical protein [Pareuzebyella sediminis]|uniref:hypothetical protein n=1 Tax=Pareuzebyella sediminis TaxID=2607998 RepID=UPI0011F03D27|nr:hypothetical protein [Pareuzebyella sediminis]